MVDQSLGLGARHGPAQERLVGEELPDRVEVRAAGQVGDRDAGAAIGWRTASILGAASCRA
jgi:hypothetical protein